MVVLVAFTVGLVFWLVYWGLGLKAFDGFLITILLTTMGAAYWLMAPWLRRQFGRPSGTSDEL